MTRGGHVLTCTRGAKAPVNGVTAQMREGTIPVRPRASNDRSLRLARVIPAAAPPA